MLGPALGERAHAGLLYAAAVGDYRVIVVRAWSKDGLAVLIKRELDGVPRERIVSLESGVDFFFLPPWRRNWAMVVFEKPDAPT